MSTTTGSIDLVDEATAGNLARAALIAALIGAFAYVSFPNPFSPAPITLQVLGVFLAGILLGPKWGAGAVVLYLAAGAIGAPVFSGGSAGLGVLFGPRAGFLWSFPIAAAAIGLVVHRGTELRDVSAVPVSILVLAMLVGTAIIYTLGILGLMLVLELELVEAVLVGAVAFLPAEAVKIAAAVGIVRSDAIAAT